MTPEFANSQVCSCSGSLRRLDHRSQATTGTTADLAAGNSLFFSRFSNRGSLTEAPAPGNATLWVFPHSDRLSRQDPERPEPPIGAKFCYGQEFTCFVED